MAAKEDDLMATKKPRLRVTVDDELLDLIIDFQTRLRHCPRLTARASNRHFRLILATFCDTPL